MFKIARSIQRVTHSVCDLELCTLLLMDDTRYDWLMLVPRLENMSEIHDPEPVDQGLLWKEVSRVSALLKSGTGCFKVNTGALGNLEPQLHVHVIARRQDDPAWPGPVWGVGAAVPYETAALQEKLARFRALILTI